jgi:hypothetical protein
VTALDTLLDAADAEAAKRREQRRTQAETIRIPDGRVVDLATGEILEQSPATTDETAEQSPATTDETQPSALVLPESFWERRPTLAHIREAARARRVAPSAVLGAVLAHVAAATPPCYCVPPIVGGTSPLSLLVALIGTTGGGKSSPMRVAAELLPPLPPGVAAAVLGSGEGLAQAYLENVETTDDTGRKVRRNKQTRSGMLFSLDEGRALGEMASRNGATILPTLCAAWSGAPIGQANASAETHRQLAAGAYALGLVAAFQPTRAAGLFDDTDGGTPGRFLYLPTSDLEAPARPPAWPGPLEWAPLPVIALGPGPTTSPLDYPSEVVDEVDERRVLALRGEIVVEQLEAHRDLLRLKVAGLLAVLDGRRTVTLDDWALTDELVAVSDRVRQSILDTATREARLRERASNERAARREITVEATLEQRALVNMARAMARRAHRNPGVVVARRDLISATNSKWRAHATVDDALEHAVAERWLVRDDDGYRAGESRPA